MTKQSAAAALPSDSAEVQDSPEVRIFSEEEAQESPEISAETIRLCAYQKWEDAGKPECDGVQFWLEAESELS